MKKHENWWELTLIFLEGKTKKLIFASWILSCKVDWASHAELFMIV